jgi:hypothetical protein
VLTPSLGSPKLQVIQLKHFHSRLLYETILPVIKEARQPRFFKQFAALAKGIERIAHEMTLLSAEVRTLRAANKALSKRRRAKKTRVRQGGALIVQDAQDILAQKDVDEQVRRDVREAGGTRGEGQLSRRRCGTCRKAGHNTRTCQEDIDISSLLDST